MPIKFRISALVPVGLIVESVAQLDDSILVTARAGIQVASYPLCGSPSRAFTTLRPTAASDREPPKSGRRMFRLNLRGALSFNVGGERSRCFCVASGTSAVSLRWRPPGASLDVGDSCLKSGAMIVSAYG